MNHKGAHMDTPDTQDVDYAGDVPFVVSHMQQVKAQGAGLISMKLVRRKASSRILTSPAEGDPNFAFRKAGVELRHNRLPAAQRK